MIWKERDPKKSDGISPQSKAGALAEKQMAHYLKRAFHGDKNIHVFNDLRFKYDIGESIQIDHLILHRHGFIIIESKSVTTEVEINEHQEWSRRYNKSFKGMPSPIKQAERQASLLKEGLNAYAEELLPKIFMGKLQQHFGCCPFEILVAISDDGRIQRKTEIPNVIKADQIPDRVKSIYQRHKKAGKFLSTSSYKITSNEGLFNFRDDTLNHIRDWLLEHHIPDTTQPTEVTHPKSKSLPISRTEKTTDLGQCPSCDGKMNILWGKYSYYWKCTSCNRTQSIKEICTGCNKKMKISKKGNRYSKICADCDVSEIYFVSS